jgi:hypothetical protein
MPSVKVANHKFISGMSRLMTIKKNCVHIIVIVVVTQVRHSYHPTRVVLRAVLIALDVLYGEEHNVFGEVLV